MFRPMYALALAVALSTAVSSSGQRRDPLEYIQIMESAERVKKLQVDRVIRTLDAQPGALVADLGAGSGLFTRPLARQVAPLGKVYAIDIDEGLLSHIEETAREQNLTNIETVLASEFDPRIPEKVDLVLIVDTLHQIKSPESYLRDLTRYLKASARIAIIDYQDNWPARLRSSKYTLQQLDAWMQSANCHRDATHEFLKDNFFVIYRYEPLGR